MVFQRFFLANTTFSQVIQTQKTCRDAARDLIEALISFLSLKDELRTARQHDNLSKRIDELLEVMAHVSNYIIQNCPTTSFGMLS